MKPMATQTNTNEPAITTNSDNFQAGSAKFIVSQTAIAATTRDKAPATQGLRGSFV